MGSFIRDVVSFVRKSFLGGGVLSSQIEEPQKKVVHL